MYVDVAPGEVPNGAPSDVTGSARTDGGSGSCAVSAAAAAALLLPCRWLVGELGFFSGSRLNGFGNQLITAGEGAGRATAERDFAFVFWTAPSSMKFRCVARNSPRGVRRKLGLDAFHRKLLAFFRESDGREARGRARARTEYMYSTAEPEAPHPQSTHTCVCHVHATRESWQLC